MKYAKILRTFSIAIILSLLVIAIPATPAHAAASITLDPEEGSIGDEITVTGEGFNQSTADYDKYAAIFFSSQEASTLDDIDSDVTIYENVRDGIWLDEYGEFEETFTVPDILNDGDTNVDVTSGTYYIYVCHYLGTSLSTRIRAVAEFTVIGGEITLDIDNGPVGTEVEITGDEFSSRDDIIIEYEGDEIDIESGDDETDSAGEFVSTISIPESTAGVHTITVTVSGNEVEAEFTVEPEILLSPTSGEADDTVTVTGTGFGRRQDVVIYLNTYALVTTTTDGQGTFEATFSVPEELEADIYDVEAEDEDENLDTAKFTITVPPPPSPPPPAPTPAPAPSPPQPMGTVSISPNTGPIGTGLIVGGLGFEAGATITIKYDNEEVAKVSADSSGVFAAPFKVPVSKHGEHTITISDGTSAHQLIFTVESTPPPVPPPLKPERGVKVKSPIYFDWKDVADDSPPVTYILQVTTGSDFSAASIVLEKEGLTKSEYTLTAEEEVELLSQEIAYYWRVRAMDGASNEGDWTGPGTFYAAPSFTLPGWAIYTLIGLGGLFLFIIGYLLGRRTAYY